MMHSTLRALAALALATCALSAQTPVIANDTLTVALAGVQKSTAGVAGTAPFDRTLQLQGITFHVVSKNDSDRPTVTITPSGLAADNRVQSTEATGHVVEAEVGDLNADGSPEVYVFVKATNPRASGSLIAYAANRRRSLSEIFLPPLTDTPAVAAGYRGHDEMRLVESSLVRRFPVYRDGDADDKPTGGMRQIQYKLATGEAGWRLRLDRVVN